MVRQPYIDQLARVYGFEGPLEAALDPVPHTVRCRAVLHRAVAPHAANDSRRVRLVVRHCLARFRAGFIAQDLLALGSRPAEIARLPQCVIAPFASPLEALGWIYVYERSTLLHDEVRRYLAVRMPESKDACVYLRATERQVSARWQDLGRRFDQAVRSPRMFQEMLGGAHNAFRAWIDWSMRDVGMQRHG